MARSFAQLARTAEKTKGSVAVPKESLDHPPLQIHTLGNGVLRQSTRRIGKVDESVRDLVRDMLRSMYAAKGIGLAAPQVGIHKQLLVLDLDLETPTTPPVVLINPEIISSSATVETYEEGCLSIPGVYLNVVRPSEIVLSFRDEMGRPRKMKADGLMARCIQHEMDHLEGVLFVDRVTDENELSLELKEHGFKRADVRPLV
ncbi:peptide deformylase [Prochlorococcus marinus]|uniref:peptide deformylase n=1 Tax=Prochlorococcus TaxID=1218 RepID=UPI0007B3CFEF|nr:peptide deformylase [Prochlorococcus marinus]KZR78446.1 Peptide deformylase [Prochlorococcus marinus str. MIT 1323]